MPDSQPLENILNAEPFAQNKLNDGGVVQRAGSISGISLSSVLELLSREAKTCLFEVAIPGEDSGLIYFYQGMIWNAVYDKQQGEEALFAMLGKKDVRVNFLKLPKKKVKRGIFGNVMSLLLKWSIKTDETAAFKEQKDQEAPQGMEFPAEITSADHPEELSLDGTPGGADGEADTEPVVFPADVFPADLPEELRGLSAYDAEENASSVDFPAEMMPAELFEELREPPVDNKEKEYESETSHDDAQDVSNAGQQQETITAREGIFTQHESGSRLKESGEVLFSQLLGDKAMGQIDDILGKFREIEGFQAVGVFSPEGEMVAVANNSGLQVEEIGALANDVLLKAQKATEIMGVGRGQVVHIDAPKAHVIARCLNESTDFSVSTQGRAHIHIVLVIAKEGNLAMSKMRLASIATELAPLFR